MPESQTTTLAKYQSILFETEGPLAVVTLNRPQRRNALSLELMTELIDCLNEIGRDRALRVVLLRDATSTSTARCSMSVLS
jgi:enoyl-CoA hydratase/carnithine racemase